MKEKLKTVLLLIALAVVSALVLIQSTGNKSEVDAHMAKMREAKKLKDQEEKAEDDENEIN